MKMVTRPSRTAAGEAFKWAGGKGAGIGAPTRGLGRFFQRTRALHSIEAMYAPHKIKYDGLHADYWARSVHGNFNTIIIILGFAFVFSPLLNAIGFYYERQVCPDRVPLPGFYNNFCDIDDPDWRLKRQMHVIELQQGPRPYGYNRYNTL